MKEKILKLKGEGKTYNQIKNILGCSISTISYHCNNNGLGSNVKLDDGLIIQIKNYYKNHTISETVNRFGVSKTTILKYCDKKRILLSDEERKKRRVESVNKRRRKIKEMAIDYKGGCCQNCGYDRCADALEFHHVDPTNKTFAIGSKGYTRSWGKVKKELDKCVMLCANCHREVHADLIKI